MERLRIVDLETGEKSNIFEMLGLWDILYAPEHGRWLAARQCDQSAGPCNSWVERVSDKVYIIDENGVANSVSDTFIQGMQWLPNEDVWAAWNDSAVFTFSPEGRQERLSGVVPNDLRKVFGLSVSPDGSLWGWHARALPDGNQGTWIGDRMTSPEAATVRLPLYTVWSPDSQYIVVFTLNGLWVAERPGFEMKLVRGDLLGNFQSDWQGVWIP